VKRTFGTAIALGLVSTLAVACASEADEGLAFTPSSAPQASDDHAAVAQRAVEDVTAYWDETYPEVYGEGFEPVAAGTLAQSKIFDLGAPAGGARTAAELRKILGQ